MTVLETFLYRAHPSWLYFSGLILLAVSVFMILTNSGASLNGLVGAVFVFLIIALSRYRRLYIISSHRVIARIGLLANNTNEMEVRHIRGINVRQGVLDRLFGIGTLEIISAADGGAEVVFRGIRHPITVKEMIRDLRATYE